MRIYGTTVLALVLALSGCKGKDKESPGAPSGGKGIAGKNATADPPPSDDRPTFRLDDRASPTAYDVSLEIDPGSEKFTGTVSISIDIERETDTIWMHGRELIIESATLDAGGEKLTAKTETGENHVLGFKFEQAIKPGKATLVVVYGGRIVRRDGAGIFAEKDGDDWYQYTQFESLDARRAFPCFDEPRWKTPWKLTLSVPSNLTAVSNTPIASEEVKGGKKRVTFEETKPLPTYLVSFGVGPFEFVPAGKSRSGVEMNIVVPKDHKSAAAYAAKVTPEILAKLEDYFGRPYPYRKLDTLIIPTTQGFGAMEHPGLVTFASRLALWNRNQETFERRRRFSLVQAHELGHQWFGNLVTMPWWDDIWLNEAFASWIENRVLRSWRPTWQLEAISMDNKEEAMLADSLASARKIRESVVDESGVESAFDSITYQKGESVLNMFETYAGRDAWQKGIRSYLKKYEWKTATAEDFLKTMSEVTGKDIETPFNSFLTQNGHPLISMKLRCDKGKAPTLGLSQARYLPNGSKASGARKWQIPICVTHAGGETCTLLVEKTAELALGKVGSKCPRWINPNKAGVGYYRSDLGAEMRQALLESGTLSVAETLSLVGDVLALVRSSRAKFDEATTLASSLASSRNALINLAGVQLADSLAAIVDDTHRPAFAKWVASTFAPLSARLGWNVGKSDSPHTGGLRAALMRLVGGHGEDPATIKTAQKWSAAWLDGKQPMAPELVAPALAIAARNGDKALLERFAARASTTANRIERSDVLVAIGHFRGELTSVALDLSLSEKIDARDARDILEAAATWRETENAVVKFVTDHYERLSERLSESQMVYLPYRLLYVCNSASRKLLATGLGDRAAKLPGGAHSLKQAIETIDLCIATRAAQTEHVTRLLAPVK